MDSLNKEYGGKVIRYEMIEWRKGNPYFTSIETWTLPMFLFHLLRHVAIILDKIANAIRRLIYRYTKENISLDNFKVES